MLWLAFISHGAKDLLWDRGNRLTLLRYACQKLKLAKLNKQINWIGSMTTKSINGSLESIELREKLSFIFKVSSVF